MSYFNEYRDAPLRDPHTGGESVIERVSQPSCPYRLAVSDLQHAQQQQKRQYEDTRPQLDQKFDGIRALLFTKEDIGAGMRLSATIVTGSHVLNGWILCLDWTIRVTMTN